MADKLPNNWRKGASPPGVRVCSKHGDVVFALPCRMCEIVKALQGVF